MSQRVLVLPLFLVCIALNASTSEAGGFLRRLLGIRAPRVQVIANAPVREVVSTSSTPVALAAPVAAPAQPCCSPTETKSDANGKIVTATMTPEQQYEKNCKTCERAYRNDPKRQAKCKEIAQSLLQKMSAEGYIDFGPGRDRPCACQFPEFPSYIACMEVYEIEINSPIEEIQRCAAACFFYCLNMVFD
jgi:hypothetical protein